MARRVAFTFLLALVAAAPASAYVHTRVVYLPTDGGKPKTLWTLPGRFASFEDVHWGPGNTTIVGLQDGFTVRLVTLDGTLERLKGLGGRRNAISGGGSIATQVDTRCHLTIRPLRGTAIKRRRLCRRVLGGYFEGMAFSRDGRRLAVLVKDRPHMRHLFVLDAETGTTLAKAALTGIRFLGDDPFDATGDHVLITGGQVRALDVRSGRVRRIDAGRLESAVYAPSAETVAGFGFYSDGAAFGPPFTHAGRSPGDRQVSAVAWDPTGTSVLVGFGGRLDRIAAPGEPPAQTTLADLGKGYITQIIPAPGGTGLIAVVTEDQY